MPSANIFSVIVGNRDKATSWDAIWRVLKWLATPGEGHGLESRFLAAFTLHCFGKSYKTADCALEVKHEHPLSSGKASWFDMTLKAPEEKNPESVAIFEDLSQSKSNEQKKVKRLIHYAELAAEKYSSTTVRLVVLTDTALPDDPGAPFSAIKREWGNALARHRNLELRFLPLCLIGSWLRAAISPDSEDEHMRALLGELADTMESLTKR